MIVLGNRRYLFADPRRCPRAMLLHLRSVLAPTPFDTLEPAPDEALVDFLNRKADCAKTVAVPFLASMLLPEGYSEAEWSPALARRIERRLRALNGSTAQAKLKETARLGALSLVATLVPPPPAPSIH